MPTLIPLREEDLKRAGIPFKVDTLRKWRTRGQNLQIFTKLGGRVFIIAEEWEKFVRKNAGRASRRYRRKSRKH